MAIQNEGWWWIVKPSPQGWGWQIWYGRTLLEWGQAEDRDSALTEVRLVFSRGVS